MPNCLMLPNHEHPMLYSTYLCLIWFFMFKIHIYPLWQMTSCNWERKVQCSHLSLQRNRFTIAVNQQSATHYFAVTLPTHNNSEYIQGFSWVSLQLCMKTNSHACTFMTTYLEQQWKLIHSWIDHD